MIDTTFRDGPPPTVMIIEDTVMHIEILQEILHREGYRVVVFRDGPSALATAEKSQPDIVLLDVMMPGMDGIEVCRRMKEDPVLRDVPVIFLSVLNDHETRLEGFEAGAVDYIGKPFDSHEVLARVNAHVELRAKERELSAAYRMLKEQEQLRDSLVHMTIHDLRSPLAVLKSTLRFLRTENLSPDGTEAIDQSDDAVRNMMEMVSLVLDVNRLESGTLQPRLGSADINTQLQMEVGRMRGVAGSRILSLAPLAVRRPVICDERLIGRVLQNLVSNAIRHTSPETGEITVSVEETDQEVTVRVRDNGSGIPKEFHEIIFDKYRQVEAKEHTSGLGLAFCKLVIDAHHGSIGVESEPGRGSSFWFTLPVGDV